MGMESMHPPIAPLRQLLGRLNAAGITAAVGGSGLLFPLGLVDKVRDWDLTTDADPAQVRRALEGLSWEDRTGNHGFETAGRFVVRQDGEELDVISRMAIRTESGVVYMPTYVTGQWDGIPLGSLEVWAAAYWVMGRTEKADLALGYLRRHGADRVRLECVLQEPLPTALREQLEALR